MMQQSMLNFNEALAKLRNVASQMGISTAEAVDAVRNLALNTKDCDFVPNNLEKARKNEYKTLHYTHEIMKD